MTRMECAMWFSLIVLFVAVAMFTFGPKGP